MSGILRETVFLPPPSRPRITVMFVSLRPLILKVFVLDRRAFNAIVNISPVG